MDFLQENLPIAYDLYSRYYEPYSTYLSPLRAAFLHYQSLYFRFLYPAIYPFWQLSNYFIRQLYSNITKSSATSPSSDALISFIAVAVLLIISLKVFNFVRRQVIWWISTATTVITYATLGFGAWYVYNRGVDASIDDAAYLVGLLMGWSQEGSAQGGRLASEREWDAERIRRKHGGHHSGKRTRGGGW